MRGHDVVEAEQVGERLDEFVRRRCGQHELAPRGAVLLDERPGVGRDERLELFGGGLAGRLQSRRASILWWRSAAARARPIDGSVLADHVEEPVNRGLRRERSARRPDPHA